MGRTLLFTLLGVAILAFALVLRAYEAPYVAFAENRIGESLPGLETKAAAGDGLSAFLLADIHRRGKGVAPDATTAIRWYLVAARAGDIRAVPGFLSVAATQATAVTPAQMATYCPAIISLLESAGRTGNPMALTVQARLFESGRCGKADPAAAAARLLAAARIDRRFSERADVAKAKLPPDVAQNLRAVPDRFDANPNEVLAKFLDEAPRLQAGLLR